MAGQISQMLVEAGNYSAKVPLQVSRNEKERIPRISYLPRNLRYLLLYDYETLLAN